MLSALQTARTALKCRVRICIVCGPVFPPSECHIPTHRVTLTTLPNSAACVSHTPPSDLPRTRRFWEIENFITRQPPIGEKDDCDIQNYWISEGLPSISRRRRGGEGRWEGGGGRERVSESEIDVGVDGAKSEIKVERMRAHE